MIPHGGEGWFPQQVPARIPAEYEKKFGTVYYFLTLNVFRQRLYGRVYRTKHSANWLEYLKDTRAEYPAEQRVHLILGTGRATTGRRKSVSGRRRTGCASTRPRPTRAT